MNHVIATIGYEGATPPSFVAALKRHGVDLIVDVRAVPFSRKPGFSKAPLAAFLKENGIGYAHLQGLGNPRKLNKAADDGKEPYRDMYLRHLQMPVAQDDLAQAAELFAAHAACLLCFEKDPLDCHRALVADALHARTGMPIVNVFVAPPDAAPKEHQWQLL